MARADVKLTLSPTDFNLIVKILEEALEELKENMRDESMAPGAPEYREAGQQTMQLERLLRELQG